MLLEGDKVEVQVLNSVLFKQVLPNQAIQIDTCLGQCVILVQRRVSLNGAEVAPVVAHVERLFLVAAKRVAA